MSRWQTVFAAESLPPDQLAVAALGPCEPSQMEIAMDSDRDAIVIIVAGESCVIDAATFERMVDSVRLSRPGETHA